MKLVVGLGNPGKEYQKTRHNVGFMIVDEVQKRLANFSNWETNKKFKAEISGGLQNNEKVILLKPDTFMNLSGESVSQVGHYYKIPPRDLIVIHDDKDLPLGDIRIQKNRGHAGHNGIRSIIEQIGTQDFTRVRVGIASESERKMKNTAKFVLGRFGIFEKKKLQETIENSVNEVIKLLEKQA